MDPRDPLLALYKAYTDPQMAQSSKSVNAVSPPADVDTSLPPNDTDFIGPKAESSLVGSAAVATGDGAGASRESTPNPTAMSCYIARQIFYANAITVQTVFTDNTEDDVLDELVFRIFSTTNLSHLLNKIERYRGLPRDSCVFYHHGRRVVRGMDLPSGMYFYCCRNFIIKLKAHVRGGACTRSFKRFLKAQDYRKGMFY
ncbi:hypothetical protein AOL_s00169g101 [Orbilia oligospora ATCC 24927]|uniref:Uncharacterized protein n=1 Tax=Arthrobotrys oligospora (strain ATCC 24927 / CBS 115.81 / DSM 1491) TaxID=756982 RepID=G1XMP8_ARTOA|nr:hypothetical protein AOL_s00169g101 [Orbilia oligospora ATCC 24927]EGX45495.1 hypothetical protein AOL_s00169g101 [Orbilia oligospora ATCC 24927]